MKHLSGMDAMFLHVESAEMPMHVGSLHVLDLPQGYAGDFFENVKDHMANRVHLASVFTRKLARMPLDLSNPVWVEDEDIDLEHHVRHITLTKPGSNRQLQQLVARLHSNLLDRSRPLWELVVIDGLKSGQVGLYAKVHHAAIDGQAGVELAKALFDLTPTGRQIKPPRQKPRRNQYQLGTAELAGAALRNAGQQYMKLLKLVPTMARAAKSLMPDGKLFGGDWTGRLGNIVAPRTRFNVAVTNQRAFAGRTVPVSEVKQIARQLGVSFNDVVMATTSGALRRFLEDGNELPSKSLTAAVPVSLRESGDATSNNQVSFTIMDLATNEADPLARLRKICESSTQRKATMGNLKAAIPMDFPMFAAPWVISGLASLYGRTQLADKMPPLANVVISNVAGVPVPLYFAGARMACYYPVSIPGHGMALNVTVQSYDQRLDYGLIACRRAIPDLNELGDHLLAEHRALFELAAHAHAGTAGERTEATTPRRTVKAVALELATAPRPSAPAPRRPRANSPSNQA